VTAVADDVKPAGANGSNEQSRVEREWEGAEEEEGEHEVEEADDREAPQTLEVLSETREGASVAKSAAAAAEQLLHLEAEQDEEVGFFYVTRIHPFPKTRNALNPPNPYTMSPTLLRIRLIHNLPP
jgi:pyruvate/2-oxoacid:ferredoxin oxidoreductase alpha subunit